MLARCVQVRQLQQWIRGALLHVPACMAVLQDQLLQPTLTKPLLTQLLAQ
jgi:hypothetical protein